MYVNITFQIPILGISIANFYDRKTWAYRRKTWESQPISETLGQFFFKNSRVFPRVDPYQPCVLRENQFETAICIVRSSTHLLPSLHPYIMLLQSLRYPATLRLPLSEVVMLYNLGIMESERVRELIW